MKTIKCHNVSIEETPGAKRPFLARVEFIGAVKYKHCETFEDAQAWIRANNTMNEPTVDEVTQGGKYGCD